MKCRECGCTKVEIAPGETIMGPAAMRDDLALRAERDRLRTALEKIERDAAAWRATANPLSLDAIRAIAREALGQ